jgi:hypothetical protein
MPTSQRTMKDNTDNRKEVQDTTLYVCQRRVSGNSANHAGIELRKSLTQCITSHCQPDNLPKKEEDTGDL